jgi:ferric-dicitrate binding protein FerR (iron transport regulator)
MDFDPKILYRYFKGTYSRNDYLKIKSVFKNQENRAELREYLEKHWNNFSPGKIPTENIDHLLDKIHHKISLEEKRTGKTSFITIFQKVAAILIVPLLLSFLAMSYFHYQSGTEPGEPVSESMAYAEIQCPLGVRTKFQLPDGTTGFLNSGSTLQYPVRFSGTRNVTVSGEVFFDVAHDSIHPFMVQTPNLNVNVLGTRFNVIAYQDGTKEEIILNEGSVNVDDKNGIPLDKLSPNQKLVLNKGKMTFSTITVEASQYMGWTEGKLIFRNEGMQEVAERLGRWYNAEIRIEDEELLDHSFHATFVDEPLEEVLNFMALTTPYTYKVLPRKKNEYDIYEKKVVLVQLDRKRLKAFL